MPVSKKNIEFIIDAMTTVTQNGTAAGAFRGAPYIAAGKTGTAQVVGIAQGARYNAAAIAKQHRDHGLFISFAPAAKPRIALAVLVENGGFGATAAAPIARAALDYWLLGKNSLGLPRPSTCAISHRNPPRRQNHDRRFPDRPQTVDLVP